MPSACALLRFHRIVVWPALFLATYVNYSLFAIYSAIVFVAFDSRLELEIEHLRAKIDKLSEAPRRSLDTRWLRRFLDIALVTLLLNSSRIVKWLLPVDSYIRMLPSPLRRLYVVLFEALFMTGFFFAARSVGNCLREDERMIEQIERLETRLETIRREQRTIIDY